MIARWLGVLLAGLCLALSASAQVALEIKTLSPDSVLAGSDIFRIQITGSGFLTDISPPYGTVARWQWGNSNPVDLPTTVMTGTILYATVNASLVAFPGTAQISVVNRTPNGQTFSGTLPFTVVAPLAIATSASLVPATEGAIYSTRLEATGGFPPYTWGLYQSALPPGLTLQSNGTLSGTPSQAGSFSFRVRVYDSRQNIAEQVFSLTVRPAVPLSIVTESPLTEAYLNIAYSNQLAASGGVPPYSWRLFAGSLPAGLGLSSGGALTGAPTQVGTFSFQARVYDTLQTSVQKTFAITVRALSPLAIDTESPLREATVNVAYSATLTASGGLAPYSWRLASGSLPAGLALSSAGAVAGTPTQAGTFSFQARVSDSLENSAQKIFSITVRPLTPLAIDTPSPLKEADLNAAYNVQLAASGGVQPYSWQVVSGGGLPAGLYLNARTGAVGGTPTQAGDFSFTIRVLDQLQSQADRLFALRVAAPLSIATASPLPQGRAGEAYSQTLNAAGGTPPYSWSRTGGTLPPGLAFTTGGSLNGTPESEGVFSFTVRVTDGARRTADQAFQLTISRQALRILTAQHLPPGDAGQPYSASFTADGGRPPYSWQLAAGGFPPGLTLSTEGVLSGSPSGGGDFGFRLRVTDAAGAAAEQDFGVRITLPALPAVSVELPGQTLPATPQTVSVTTSSAYPVDLNGSATLTFQPDATAPSDDPAVQFSSGGRTAAFVVPAGATSARFGDLGSLGIQTGSVAGRIVVQVTVRSDMGVVSETREMVVSRSAPAINSVTVSQTTGGFEIRVIGLSSPRDMSQATFRFTARSGSTLQTSEFTVNLGTVFSTWYQSAASAPFGSTFRYVQPFTVQGSTSAIGSVTVILRNSQGDSQPASANF